MRRARLLRDLAHAMKLPAVAAPEVRYAEPNGPEFIAEATRRFFATATVETLFINPSSPWQNGYCESFNSRLRDELLNLETFTSTLEARVLSERWRREYNEQRPHGALGYRTPRQVLDEALETGTRQAPRLTAAMAQA